MAQVTYLRSFGRHLFLVAVVAIPVALVVFYFIQRGTFAAEQEGILDLTVIYPGLLLVMSIGAMLYTMAIEFIAQRRAVTAVIAIGLTPVLVLPWFALPIRALVLWFPFSLSLLAGLLAFGFLAWLLRRAHDRRHAAA